jgi:hypothetical protein
MFHGDISGHQTWRNGEFPIDDFSQLETSMEKFQLSCLITAGYPSLTNSSWIYQWEYVMRYLTIDTPNPELSCAIVGCVYKLTYT